MRRIMIVIMKETSSEMVSFGYLLSGEMEEGALETKGVNGRAN